MVRLVLRESLETLVPREMLVLLDLLELQVHLDLRYKQHSKRIIILFDKLIKLFFI